MMTKISCFTSQIYTLPDDNDDVERRHESMKEKLRIFSWLKVFNNSFAMPDELETNSMLDNDVIILPPLSTFHPHLLHLSILHLHTAWQFSSRRRSLSWNKSRKNFSILVPAALGARHCIFFPSYKLCVIF